MRRLPALLVLVAACAEEEAAPPQRRTASEAAKRAPPRRIGYDHILVAFKGLANDRTGRTREEAEALTRTILRKLEDGARFEDLAELYSDHRHPESGEPIIRQNVCNFGVKPYPFRETAREAMYQGVAEVVFSLEVGETDVVPYDPTPVYNRHLGRDVPLCPEGWLIVHRVR